MRHVTVYGSDMERMYFCSPKIKVNEYAAAAAMNILTKSVYQLQFIMITYIHT